MKKYILNLILFCGILFAFSSCRTDELDTESIFVDTGNELDPNSHSYLLDRWLYDNYLIPYNVQFRYRMEDVGSDMNYNLIPTSYERAVDMAVLVKYLWFDVYAKAVREDFLKENGPRIIHLIGSPAYNPANGTMILGLAEGGLKISMFRCNEMDITNLEVLNEFYFKTMHHEFCHILHQKKTYSKEFNLISPSFYQPFSWQDRDEPLANSLGFVSSYAGCEAREDFVEVIANYIVKTDAQWAQILYRASKGWQVKLKDGEPVEEFDIYGRKVKVYEEAQVDTDGVDGKAVIEQKLQMCKEWLHYQWEIELDSLRKIVQERQLDITVNIDSLRNQLTSDYLH
jgi:substrate import-associated zinc metallohydrolase lipoprotein